MPVNPGVEYLQAEEKYHNARTSEEKLLALAEMLRTIPKHKQTENIRKEFTRKMAKLREEVEKEKTSGAKKGGGQTFNVKKEGEAQIAIIGSPNSGKSTLLLELTGVQTEIAPYPFTTKEPVVGMMNYRETLIQLVEMPAIIDGSSDGKASGIQVLSAIRNADAIAILFMAEEDKKTAIKELEKADIFVNREKPKVIIKVGEYKGISLGGTQFLREKPEKITATLKAFGIHNASVLFQEPCTSEMLARALNQKIVYKKALFINQFEKHETQELKKKLFELTGKIIVFTKKPGEKADTATPLVLDQGSTVEDFAKKLHKDLAKNLRFVRVWGSTKFEGQRVSKDYILQNEDIIELTA
ncbi:MAG: TGS domain-containing protein [archaeon]|nr:TGS domain-containing protein [archaeon]